MAGQIPNICTVCESEFKAKNRSNTLCSDKCRKASIKRSRKKNKAKWVLFNTYGLTTEDYDRMHEAQGGRCAICGDKPEGNRHLGKLFVDHDHDTGDVRALLCHRCNTGLGMFRDNVDNLIVAAAYLKEHS